MKFEFAWLFILKYQIWIAKCELQYNVSFARILLMPTLERYIIYSIIRQDMASARLQRFFRRLSLLDYQSHRLTSHLGHGWLSLKQSRARIDHSIFGIRTIARAMSTNRRRISRVSRLFSFFVFGHFRADWVFRFDWNEFCQPTGCPFVTTSDVRLFVPLERSLIDGSSTWSPSFRLFLASRLYSLTLSLHEKGECDAWEKEKELDILRFLTTIGLYVDRWRKRQSDDRDWQPGQRGEERGKGECVKACTATKDHEKFLEIDLYEGEREATSRREIEVMRLILCFLCFQRTAVSFGYRTRAFFSRFAPSMQSRAPPSSLLLLSPLSFSLFFSRHNEAFMSWTSALVLLFLLGPT